MSYNVTHVSYISGKLTITRENIIRALEEFGGNTPEAGFISDFIWDGQKDVDPETLPEGPLPIRYPGFFGCGSRRGMEACEEWLYSLTKGKADILVTWEGGESYEGYRVINGRVTGHKVVHTLGEKL